MKKTDIVETKLIITRSNFCTFCITLAVWSRVELIVVNDTSEVKKRLLLVKRLISKKTSKKSLNKSFSRYRPSHVIATCNVNFKLQIRDLQTGCY